MNSPAENKQIVEDYWDAFFRKDWKRVARFFAEDANYTDVGIDPVGAIGPAEIVTRLMNAIDSTRIYHHLPRHMIAEGRIVMTEHVEVWGFEGGEPFENAFVSVMELKDGKITRWHDYSATVNISNNAPPAWFEMASNWRDRIKPLHEIFPGEGFDTATNGAAK